MSAREIAERLGGDTTGQQVGAVLRRLHAEGRVEMIEYQPRPSGFTTRHWIAAEWAGAADDEDDDRAHKLIEQLRRIADA
jgi:predicted ArsR family transcriptional regulator